MRCFDNIAKLIRTKRINHPKGYSQSELSSLLGYKNGQFISNVERALCNIPLKMLAKVSEVLDIPADDLKKAMLKDHDLTIDNHLRASIKTREQGGMNNVTPFPSKEESTTQTPSYPYRPASCE